MGKKKIDSRTKECLKKLITESGEDDGLIDADVGVCMNYIQHGISKYIDYLNSVMCYVPFCIRSLQKREQYAVSDLVEIFERRGMQSFEIDLLQLLSSQYINTVHSPITASNHLYLLYFKLARSKERVEGEFKRRGLMPATIDDYAAYYEQRKKALDLGKFRDLNDIFSCPRVFLLGTVLKDDPQKVLHITSGYRNSQFTFSNVDYNELDLGFLARNAE